MNPVRRTTLNMNSFNPNDNMNTINCGCRNYKALNLARPTIIWIVDLIWTGICKALTKDNIIGSMKQFIRQKGYPATLTIRFIASQHTKKTPHNWQKRFQPTNRRHFRISKRCQIKTKSIGWWILNECLWTDQQNIIK